MREQRAERNRENRQRHVRGGKNETSDNNMIARDRQKQSIYTHGGEETRETEETESLLRSSIRQRTKDRQVRTTRICLAWEKDGIRSSEAELTKVRLAREREREKGTAAYTTAKRKRKRAGGR